VIDLERGATTRGFFARTFCAREFAEQGLATHLRAGQHEPVGHDAGTLRGLHYQHPPPRRPS
jgi:dTDP-4-dehydrorhamnose 3,5-epimerase